MSESAAEGTTGTEGVEEGTEVTETETEGTEAAAAAAANVSSEELAKWKAEARKWESRAKENTKAARELGEIRAANMTELEKAQAAQRDAEDRAEKATAMHNRVMAAAAHDLPIELIEDLGSGTEEEINERAERFATIIEEAVTARTEELTARIEELTADRNGQQQTGARPVESMRPGSAPASAGTAKSADDWFRQLLGDR